MADETVELALEFQAEPNAADAQVVADGLLSVLAADLGAPRREPFALILRRQDDSVAGGLVGKVLFSDLHVDQLWLHESARCHGHGRRLMEEAEAHGVRQGCASAYLNTMSSTVLEFYLEIGFYELGRVKDFPVGHTVYFLRKDLGGAS
ncbi:MAG: GNAT family N-acetyltransferase [Gemmatimonadota bacterium]|nr:GNAT family N-acetyltransferase [Gemmatimonadota bacterium]MDH3424314.1 GNAT family N-acetyltransferase [Gemmatimonadota bacterium]